MATEDYGTFDQIQEAIDNAEEGTVFKLTGTFYGFGNSININKCIGLVGSDQGTTLRANINSNVKSNIFYINSSASNVLLKNLKISNGDSQWGGAIYCWGNYCTITDCEFKDNLASGNFGYGGAICCWGYKCLITNSTFTSNHCTDYGGAIYLNGNNTEVSNCIFNNNYVQEGVSNWQGGGAIYSDCNGAVINNCTFNSNYARDANGGAIKHGSERLTIKRCNFKNNFAINGTAIFAGEIEIVSNCFNLEIDDDKENIVYGKSVEELLSSNNIFNVTKIDSSVTFSAGMIFEYGASGSIYVTVDGGSINQNNIKVLNHPEAKITFSKNVLVVSNLAVGKYILRVTTIPDENHNSVESDLSITVKKATAVIKASKITVAYKKGSQWTVKFVDSKNSKPISNMKVTLKVYTGKKYKTVTLNTNSKGEVSYQTKKLSKGKHKVIVTASDSRYNFNSHTYSINVVKQTKLKFTFKSTRNKDSTTVMFRVYKGKKPVNGVSLNLNIYNCKKVVKIIKLKTKTYKKIKGIVGYTTNELSVGKHKVILIPASIKYGGSKKGTLKLTKKQVKYPNISSKVSA